MSVAYSTRPPVGLTLESAGGHHAGRAVAADVCVLRVPAARAVEAGLQGLRARAAGGTLACGLPTAQVAVEVLPEYAAHAVQRHGIDARVQETRKKMLLALWLEQN